MTLLEQAVAFRQAYDQEIHTGFTRAGFIKMKLMNMQVELVREECREFLDAASDLIDQPNDDKLRVNFLKELSDIVFVAYQCAAAYSLDLDTAMERVFESNMSKLGDDGKPIYRNDGKVLKGPNYKEPKLDDLVELASDFLYDTSSK